MANRKKEADISGMNGSAKLETRRSSQSPASWNHFAQAAASFKHVSPAGAAIGIPLSDEDPASPTGWIKLFQDLLRIYSIDSIWFYGVLSMRSAGVIQLTVEERLVYEVKDKEMTATARGFVLLWIFSDLIFWDFLPKWPKKSMCLESVWRFEMFINLFLWCLVVSCGVLWCLMAVRLNWTLHQLS